MVDLRVLRREGDDDRDADAAADIAHEAEQRRRLGARLWVRLEIRKWGAYTSYTLKRFGDYSLDLKRPVDHQLYELGIIDEK